MHQQIAEAKRAQRLRLRRARAARLGPPDTRTVGTMAGALLAAARSAGLLDPQGCAGRVGPTVVAAYLAMPGEPDPVLICETVRTAGGDVLLPRPIPGRRMEWALDDGGRGVAEAPVRVPVPRGPTVGTAAAALLEARVRVLFLPALAVDEAGHRLGQGGGFYDRLLAELTALGSAGNAPLRVALVHDDEVLPAGQIPVDELDQPVQAALTPTGLRRFGAGAPDGSGG